MSTKTVKVTNLSLDASQRDINEFFSFSGDIDYIEMKSCDEKFQIAYVTFKDYQGAEAALLLSGATIVDSCILISLAPDYQLPVTSFSPSPDEVNRSPFRKAEDIVTSMLAKGFILGKDVINKAKAFDEKHQLSSTVSTKVNSLNEKMGLSHKISMGTSAVNGKVREVDQRYQFSEKTKSASSAVTKNRYVVSGCSWVSGAFGKVVRVAGDVGQKTKEKVGKAEEEQKRKMVDEFAELHLPESPKASSPSSHESSKPATDQVLIF